ncbi:MAG: LEPR-XLL domain-containing protein, partial [Burkholderiales bacterium]
MNDARPSRLLDIIRRMPSLYDIFFGKLANWFRRIAQWRKQGLLRKALRERRRRNAMRMEAMEQRLLLSADLTYTDISVFDLTLIAKDADTLELIQTGNPGNSLGMVDLDAGAFDGDGNVEINIKRLVPMSTEFAGDAFADRLRIDMSTLDLLNGFVASGGGNTLELHFEGGDETLFDDHVNLQGTGSYTLGFGLHIASSSDIETGDGVITGFGDLTVGGDFAVQSEDEIRFEDSIVRAGVNNITLSVNASSNGIFGIENIGASSALVRIDGGELHGGDVGITASSEVTISPDALGGTAVKAAVAIADSDAEVLVTGGAIINASGNLNVNALSQVNATAEILPGTDGTEDETTDAAVADTTIISDSRVKIRGASDLQADGNLNLVADNQVTAVTKADAHNAGKGAAVAVSVMTGETTAFMDGGSKAQGDTVLIGANSVRETTTTAISSPGGAADGGGTNRSEEVLADPNDDGDSGDRATTSGGDINVAGAVAVNIVTTTTTAYVDSSGQITATGAVGDTGVKISSSSKTTSTANADGSTTDSSAGTGIGVGVAMNFADVDSTSYVAGSSAISSPDGVTIEALIPQSTFTAQATSGAGGSDVGTAGAGSLAINVVVTDVSATIEAGAILDLGLSDLTIRAESTTDSIAFAQPKEAGALGMGDDGTGIGASVAMNITDNDTIAAVEEDAQLTDSDDVSILATSDHGMDTKAETGASGSNGFAGSVALAISGNDTQARIDDGTIPSAALDIGGDLMMTAEHAGAMTTLADSKATGADAGIGVAMALTFAKDATVATTTRDLSVGRSAQIVSRNASSSKSEAKSGAQGTPDGGGGGDIDAQVAGERGVADSRAGTSGAEDSGASTTPSASTDDGSGGGGSLTVAAAIGINVAEASSEASIDGATVVASGGAVELRSSQDADAEAIGDGSATDGETGIGAAVAINAATADNRAVIENGSDVTADGVTLEASMLDNADTDGVNTFRATSTSGASASDTGFAGSFALNKSDSDTESALLDGSILNLGTSDLQITAGNSSDARAEATANSDGANTGVGVSVGINIATNNDTRAVIEDGAVLTGGNDVTLSATGSHEVDTLATGGGKSTGDTGVGGALALTVADNVTEAVVGSGAKLEIAGAFNAEAVHHGSSETTAKGEAEGGSTAVGAAIALAFVDDSALATTGRDITAGGAVSFAARGDGASKVEAIASSAGADSDEEATKGNTSADGQIDSATGLANKQSGETNTVDKSASTDDGDADTSGDGGVSVGAALALNVSNSDAEASIGADRTIVAGGEVALRAENNMDAAAIADGSAAGGEGATSVGVAVALNIAHMSNTATVGANSTISGEGFEASALMKEVDGDSTHKFAAHATSGASGGDTGVAGSFALNYSEAQAEAVLPGTVTVNAGTGDVLLSAGNTSESDVQAKASTSGSGETGVGVSVGINIATNNDTRAVIE